MIPWCPITNPTHAPLIRGDVSCAQHAIMRAQTAREHPGTLKAAPNGVSAASGGRASRSNVRRIVYAGSVGSVWISQMGNVGKHVGCHTLRHSFATHLHEAGFDIRMIHERLGQKNVSTTMIYTRVLNKGATE